MPSSPSPFRRRLQRLHREAVTALAALGVVTAAVPATARADRKPPPAQTDTILRLQSDKCYDLNDSSLAVAPAIKASFDLMARQPITGRPVMARLSNPMHGFQVCEDPNLPSIVTGTIASYRLGERRLMVPAKGADLSSVAHESFHAYQATLSSAMGGAPLAPRDKAMALLIAEAAAVGYTYMVTRESAFDNPADWNAYTKAGGDYGMNDVFNAAFDSSYNGLLPLPDETLRRRFALEAGGRAVVDALLNKAYPAWSEGYAFRALTMARNGDDSIDATTRSYYKTRDELFRRAAMVAPDILLLPPRLGQGAKSDAEIVKVLELTGVQIRTVPVPEFNPGA